MAMAAIGAMTPLPNVCPKTVLNLGGPDQAGAKIYAAARLELRPIP